MIKQAHWLTVALVSGLTLGACNRPESPAETQRDMAEAARESSENVREAQHEAREARADNMENAAEAQEDVVLAKAKADYKVAVQACDAQTGDTQDRCQDLAKSTLNVAQARADQERDRQDAAAERNKP